ncbi:MAG: FAD-dependent oxidoreductase [Oscillospiraceae bacterium]|nr:FAD-dependent oxidoreductase [Oscillospiraceae bacterium]
MKYVIIGSSAAGINAARELRRLDGACEIVLVSRDKEIYSRCILHEYLSGHRTVERLNFSGANFIEEYSINWMKGRDCTAVKPADHVIVLDGEDEVSYDKLLIATGSHTFYPPMIKNLLGSKNMVGFRNIEDIEVLKEVAKTCKNIVVMGSGLVGIDCTVGFLELGVKVTMVDFAGWMLNRQLDERAAKTYQDMFAARGVKQYFGVGMSEAIRDENDNIVECVLTNGVHLPCDFLVMTAGVRSNVEFLAGSGLETSRFGLVFDETGKTSDPDIYGAGDVSGLSPIWPVAVKEGIIAASNMAGVPRKMTDFFASKSTMNFLGLPSMSLGNANPEDDSYTVETRETEDTYKKIVHKNGRITGAILQGDLAYSGVLQQLIARKIDITKVKKPVFDIDYSDFFHVKENFEFYYED